MLHRFFFQQMSLTFLFYIMVNEFTEHILVSLDYACERDHN